MAFSPLSRCEKIRRARALRVRATKSPARCPARAFRRSFGEYAFLEDSRYASQEENACGKRGAPKGELSSNGPGFAPRLASATLADFSRARDSQITFSVTHGWS